MSDQPKFVQIAVGTEQVGDLGVDNVYALDDDGRVWTYDWRHDNWAPLSTERR